MERGRGRLVTVCVCMSVCSSMDSRRSLYVSALMSHFSCVFWAHTWMKVMDHLLPTLPTMQYDHRQFSQFSWTMLEQRWGATDDFFFQNCSLQFDLTLTLFFIFHTAPSGDTIGFIQRFPYMQYYSQNPGHRRWWEISMVNVGVDLLGHSS